MSLISKPITRRALVRGGTLLIGAAALPTLPLAAFAQGRSFGPVASSAGQPAERTSTDGGNRGLMLMNRIAPSSSDLYISNADGSGERKLLDTSGLDYNASFASDGQSIVFTSERNGDGNSDVFRCRADGTDIQPLVIDPAVDDAAVLSPDGTRLAFVSTRDGYRANVWVMDLRGGAIRNLTGAAHVQGNKSSPNSFLRLSWSPDGQWLAFFFRPQYRLAGSRWGQGLGAYARAEHLCHPRRWAELPPHRLQAWVLPRFSEMVARRTESSLLRDDN